MADSFIVMPRLGEVKSRGHALYGRGPVRRASPAAASNRPGEVLSHSVGLQ